MACRGRRDRGRGRPDRDDAGGRVGAGRGRRRDRGAARDAGAGGVAGGRVPLAHHRDPRPARDRRPVPRRGADRPGGVLREHAAGPQRLPDPAPVLPRPVPEPHRADPGRLDRGAGRAGPSGPRRDRVRPGRRRGRRPPRGSHGADPLRAGYLVGGGRRAQRDPQGGGHRVPRLGRDQEQPDRRGGGDRGDAGGSPHRRDGDPRAAPHGGRADRAGRRDRAAARPGHRTHPRRPQRRP